MRAGSQVSRLARGSPSSTGSTPRAEPRAQRRFWRSSRFRLALGLVGAAVLIGLGARTLYSAFRVRLGGEVDAEVATPRRAFLTSLAGTASNPLTIASWAAIFAAASAAGAAHTAGGAVLLVAGVGLGSLVWVSALATGTALARRTIGQRAIRAADAIAGLDLVGFGGALAYNALQ